MRCLTSKLDLPAPAHKLCCGRMARLTLVRTIWLAFMAQLIFGSSLSYATFQFTDASVDAGVEPYDMIPGLGAGVAVADFDDDGDIDIFVPTAPDTADRLYVNLGGGAFEERAAERGLDSLDGHRTALWFDYDGDHRLDLVVAGDCYPEVDGECQGTLALYRQTVDGNFEDTTSQAGELEFTDLGHVAGIAAGDIDGDGYHDLFLCSWLFESRIFHNNGDGTFDDIGSTSGIELDSLQVWMALFHDFNGDGRQDIYLVVDFGQDQLLLNQGGNSFVNVASEAGMNFGASEMGVAPGDYDNDGDIDLFVTNINPDNRFHRNDSSGGTLTFTNIATAEGMDATGWAWGSTFLDANNDGLLDLAVTNGYFTTPEYREDPSVFFVNRGGSPVTFDRVSDEVGFNDTLWGSALLAADYNRDGRQDLIEISTLISVSTSYVRILRNNPQPMAPTNRFLVVKPRQDGPNHRAIGALVRVSTGATTMTRLITAGTSFMGQEPAEAHFGLGGATLVDVLTIEWPNGDISQFENVGANQLITATREGLSGQLIGSPINQGIISNPPLGFIEEGATWVLTAPVGIGHSWTWPGAAGNVTPDGNTLTVVDVDDTNLGTYRVEFEDGIGGKGVVELEITLNSLLLPGSLPAADRWVLGVLAVLLLGTGYAVLRKHPRCPGVGKRSRVSE